MKPRYYAWLPRPTTPPAPIRGGGGGGGGSGGGGVSGSGAALPQECQGLCNGDVRLHRGHIAHPVAHNQVVSLPVHASDELDAPGRVEDESLRAAQHREGWHRAELVEAMLVRAWLGLGLGLGFKFRS